MLEISSALCVVYAESTMRSDFHGQVPCWMKGLNSMPGSLTTCLRPLCWPPGDRSGPCSSSIHICPCLNLVTGMRMLRVSCMLYLSLWVLMCTLQSMDAAVNGVWVQAPTMWPDSNSAGVVECAHRKCSGDEALAG